MIKSVSYTLSENVVPPTVRSGCPLPRARALPPAVAAAPPPPPPPAPPASQRASCARAAEPRRSRLQSCAMSNRLRGGEGDEAAAATRVAQWRRQDLASVIAPRTAPPRRSTSRDRRSCSSLVPVMVSPQCPGRAPRPPPSAAQSAPRRRRRVVVGGGRGGATCAATVVVKGFAPGGHRGEAEPRREVRRRAGGAFAPPLRRRSSLAPPRGAGGVHAQLTLSSSSSLRYAAHSGDRRRKASPWPAAHPGL